VLSASLVKDKRLDYVALGHIHKPQNINENGHHPVIYPGSIERVDFGEIDDKKMFIIAEIEKDEPTKVRKLPLNGRPFISRSVMVENSDDIQGQIMRAIPDENSLKEAIFRLVITYPRDWEAMIDETAIRRAAASAFEFHFIRRPITSARLRLPEDVAIASLTSADLVSLYWKTMDTGSDEIPALDALAGEIIQAVEIGTEGADTSGEMDL